MSDKHLRQETIDTYNNSAVELAQYFQGIGSRTVDIEKALASAGSPNKPRIVEIGCGDGRDAKEIAKRADYFEAFDISDELVKIAQINAPGTKITVADAVTFEYPDNLDVVYAFASLLHLSKEECTVVFSKVATALRKDGIFYISLKHKDSYQEGIKEDKFGKRLFYFYDLKTVADLAKGQFKIIESYTKNHGETAWLEVTLQKK